MLLAALLFALTSATSSEVSCPNDLMPARLAAASAPEGAAALIRSSRGGDAAALTCAQALAVQYGEAAPWLERRYFTAARAAVAIRQNDPAAAVALLEPMVGFQHHTVAIPADFHALLSEAYDKAGRYDEAEGQRRMALAAMTEAPPFALSEAEIRAMPARDPFTSLLPLNPPNPELNTLDLASIQADGHSRLYDTVLLAPQDKDGEAARRVQRRVDCQTRRGEVLKIIRLGPDGAVLEEIKPDDPREDTSAVVSHRRLLVCEADIASGHARADLASALSLFRSRVRPDVD